jgi:hypothetical protein
MGGEAPGEMAEPQPSPEESKSPLEISMRMDRDRLEKVAAILTESLEGRLFPAEQMNEQATFLRAQMKNILKLIEEWKHQTLDARSIEDFERDERFLLGQTGHILRLTKQQIEETEGNRNQLAAHGEILENILLKIAPDPSQSPMYVHPRNTWKSVFKCECQSAKPPHPSPPKEKENANTSTTLNSSSFRRRCRITLTSV